MLAVSSIRLFFYANYTAKPSIYKKKCTKPHFVRVKWAFGRGKRGELK